LTPPITFFTDECFIYKANALLEAFDRENKIRALVDHFPRGTPDVEWLRAVASWDPKPAIVCGDARILKNKVERAVLKDAGVTFLCLAPGWTNLPWPTFAWKIIKVWPDVVQEVTRVLRPTVFEISPQTLKIEKRYQLT
jgi:hypothetical protein